MQLMQPVGISIRQCWRLRLASPRQHLTGYCGFDQAMWDRLGATRDFWPFERPMRGNFVHNHD